MTSKKNILVLTYWSFNEALVQTYTLPYVKLIHDELPEGSFIYLVTLEQENLRMSGSEKLKVKKELNAKGITLITFKYRRFSVLAILEWMVYCFRLLFLVLSKNVRRIHVWCTPAAAIGYVLSLTTGRALVVDSYEPHAESMVENGTWSRNSMAFKLLFFLEKKITAHAKILIAASSGMYSYAIEKYGITPELFFVKPACVDIVKFSTVKRKNKKLIEELGLDGKIVCVYAGKFGGIYFDKEVFYFFKVASDYFGDSFRALILTSANQEELVKWATESGFSSEKMVVRFISNEMIADYIGLGDFAINPVKPVPSKRYCTSIKDGEYWAMGLPVVITEGISDDSEIIVQNNIGVVIKNFSNEECLGAAKKIGKLIEEDEKEKTNGRAVDIAVRYRNYDIAKKVYRDIYGKKFSD